METDMTNNVLMAIFLGGTLSTHDSLKVEIIELDYTWYFTEHQDWSERNLLFDTSWDWLMRSVKRIYNFDTNKLPCESDGWLAYYGLESALFAVDIKGVYDLCVKFINWKNDQF